MEARNKSRKEVGDVRSIPISSFWERKERT